MNLLSKLSIQYWYIDENNIVHTSFRMMWSVTSRPFLTNQKYALNLFSAELIKIRGIFMLSLKRVQGLVGTAQNKRTLWRSMFWTLLSISDPRCACAFLWNNAIDMIDFGLHCVRTYRVYSWGNEFITVNIYIYTCSLVRCHLFRWVVYSSVKVHIGYPCPMSGIQLRPYGIDSWIFKG